MSKQKWYVVWQGKSPGIFTNWDDAKQQVHGFKGAKYQSFKTQWAAEEAFKSGPDSFQDLRSAVLPDIIENSISVDAACKWESLVSLNIKVFIRHQKHRCFIRK